MQWHPPIVLSPVSLQCGPGGLAGAGTAAGIALPATTGCSTLATVPAACLRLLGPAIPPAGALVAHPESTPHRALWRHAATGGFPGESMPWFSCLRKRYASANFHYREQRNEKMRTASLFINWNVTNGHRRAESMVANSHQSQLVTAKPAS